MEYYTLKTSSDKRVIGYYPQVDCQTIFQAQLLSPAELMKCAPKLIFELKRRAQKTDVLATTSGPLTDFLVNDKTLKVFSEFNLMRHQVFDVTVITSKKNIEYYWLHFTQPELSFLLDYMVCKCQVLNWVIIFFSPSRGKPSRQQSQNIEESIAQRVAVTVESWSNCTWSLIYLCAIFFFEKFSLLFEAAWVGFLWLAAKIILIDKNVMISILLH